MELLSTEYIQRPYTRVSRSSNDDDDGTNIIEKRGYMYLQIVVGIAFLFPSKKAKNWLLSFLHFANIPLQTASWEILS